VSSTQDMNRNACMFSCQVPITVDTFNKNTVCQNISARLTTQIFMKWVISSQSVTSKQRSKADLIFELLQPSSS